MSIRNFDGFFAPRSVALIGASRKPHSVGAVIARNLLSAGFEGPVMPVNPGADAIHSTIAYPDVAALPVVPDLAVICTPPDTVPGLIADLGARGTRAAVVITAGFAELGEAGRALQAQMLEAARSTTLRIIGPNCLGLLVPRIGLNASFAQLHPRPGKLAFCAQSGAMITSVLDWADARGIGFSALVSMGGMADADFGDFLDYLAGDPETQGILLYIEAVTHARKFMSAARRAARLKPVVVIKAGRHEAGAKAAASHTGALAGSDAVYDAAFRRAGMLRVTTLDALFDAVETLAANPPVAGDRLAILTNGGGVGVLATDALIEANGRLAALRSETLSALDAVLPRTWSRGNPIDIIGDAPGSRYEAAMAAVLSDPGVDAVLALNCPTAIADSADAARAVITACAPREGGGRRVPVFTSWLGAQGPSAARTLFAQAGLPTFDTPEEAVAAFMHLVDHAQAQAALREVPDPPPAVSSSGRAAARALVREAVAAGRVSLSEAEAKSLLAAYGVPVVETQEVSDPEAAVRAAEALGFPVAIKILSPDISHKSDVGGVSLGLTDAGAVRAAAEAMLARVRAAAPQARLAGFTVQRMAARPGAHELIVGLAEDAVFGPVILFGHGGTAVEIVRDKAISLLPINDRLARDLIQRTRISRLLAGYRDKAPADVEAVVATLLALGELAADNPEVAELDINPLWADPRGVLALDARVRLNPRAIEGDARFAIRPYPRALEREIETRGGGRYAVRPIRPDDASRLQDMIAACDLDDIRMRFFSALKRIPEQLALRLTQIDYDREMALVATEGHDGALAGVVRLSADPDGVAAEYAVIVRSDLKGTGLGYRLMQDIIAYARDRGLTQIFGEVLHDNVRMRSMCRELGFAERTNPDDASLVTVTLALAAGG